MSALLNLSGKIDPQTVTVFEIVGCVIAELGMPYVVVGATARDLILHYGHGAAIRRATQDVDFAIEVPDWPAFEVLGRKLCEQGFRTTGARHRLISPSDVVVDIVPFGQLEEEGASIKWPPKGEVVMNVLGFQEACDNAEWVRIQESPELDVPVATPAGMSLLKIIAWTDRAGDLRRKDATDLAYLLSTYEKIPRVTDILYGEGTQVMERYDWDITQSSAHLLGQHAHSIAQDNTRSEIARFVKGEFGGRNPESLIDEMCAQRMDSQYERNKQLLSAFLAGFGISI